MDITKKIAIEQIIDTSIRSFVSGFEARYEAEIELPTGVINQKKNNVFIRELGEEFMFYSAFVRSFDSSFGNVLENMGKAIARLTFEVRNEINSFMLPQQYQHIDYLMSNYHNKVKPLVSDYDNFHSVQPPNIESYRRIHQTDNYFYNPNTHTHVIIELKAGGDLDIKKARSEKEALLTEYFMLKNLLRHTDDHIEVKFATAYNKFGEGNDWKQSQVRTFFAEDELLIGKDYWNFVCDDEQGFEIVLNQYRVSSTYIKSALERIKDLYFQE